MNELKHALRGIWEYIGSDYLELSPRHRCKGIEVQEAVADRIGMYPATKQNLETWNALTSKEQDDLLNELFPKKQWFGY